MREVEGTVMRIGGQGDGVMDTPAGRLYVPYTVPGDVALVRIGKPRADGFAAELRVLHQAGPDRAEPPCPHFLACGGCALQHLDDAAYAAWKRDQVVRALARHGFADAPVEPLVRTPPGRRRRADVVLRRLAAGVLAGFHERGSRRIVDVTACPVLRPELVALLPPLRAALAPWLAVGEGVDVRMTATETGCDVTLVGRLGLGGRARAALAAFAAEQDLARLAAQDTASGFVDPIAMRRAPSVRFGDVAVEIAPAAFLQASADAEAAMVAEALSAAPGARRVIDLYAGCGTFSFPLAQTGAQVRAFDGDAAAIDALRTAARRAGLEGRVTAEVRDLARRPLNADELKGADAVVFDPPRAGAKEQAAGIAAAGVPVVVGISCNPASFARDARILADAGYRLERIVPVDQFLWSPHVELTGVFRR